MYDISVIRRDGRVCVESVSEQVVGAPDTCPITTAVSASAVVCFTAVRVVYAYGGGRRDIDVIVKMKRPHSSDILARNGRGCISSFIYCRGEQCRPDLPKIYVYCLTSSSGLCLKIRGGIVVMLLCIRTTTDGVSTRVPTRYKRVP